MTTAQLSFLCCALALAFGCGSAASGIPVSPLDYAEIVGNDGWYLRVHGDGSGTLTHRQHPLHHLDYPTAFFELHPARKVSRNCRRENPALGCYDLVYYRAKQDELTNCSCSTDEWMRNAMDMAVRNMQITVDDASSERACRMLRRAWLASN